MFLSGHVVQRILWNRAYELSNHEQRGKLIFERKWGTICYQEETANGKLSGNHWNSIFLVWKNFDGIG